MTERHTFVVTLLVDSDQPGVLRGRLRPVGDGSDRPGVAFAAEEELVALLRAQAARGARPVRGEDR